MIHFLLGYTIFSGASYSFRGGVTWGRIALPQKKRMCFILREKSSQILHLKINKEVPFVRISTKLHQTDSETAVVIKYLLLLLPLLFLFVVCCSSSFFFFFFFFLVFLVLCSRFSPHVLVGCWLFVVSFKLLFLPLLPLVLSLFLPIPISCFYLSPIIHYRGASHELDFHQVPRWVYPQHILPHSPRATLASEVT